MSTPVQLTFRRNNLLVEDPHLKSLAALILLVGEYRQCEAKQWMEFKEGFLKGKDLICYYCGREDLILYKEGESLRKIVTLDHVIALANGGAEYDPDNVVIACSKCNRNKADKVL